MMRKILMLLGFMMFVQFVNAQDTIKSVMLTQEEKVLNLEFRISQLEKLKYETLYNQYTHKKMAQYQSTSTAFSIASFFLYGAASILVVKGGDYTDAGYFIYSIGGVCSIVSVVSGLKARLIHNRRWITSHDRMIYKIIQ